MTQAQLDKQALRAAPLSGIDAVHLPATRRTTETAWSDAFAIGAERIVVSAGNVAGADADVSVLLLAVRAAFDPGSGDAEPKMLLNAADTFIRRRSVPGTPFASAIVGIIDRFERTFTYVSAGHPPPFVRYHDGTVAALPADELPLNPAANEHPPAQIVVDLNEAALVLLYSRALVGDAAAEAEDGLRSVHDVLADARMAPCSSPAAWIARQVLGDVSHDEATLLALTLPPGSGPSPIAEGERPHWSAAWTFDTSSSASNGARRAFLACLKSKRGAAVIDVPAAELIFGELLGNVVRHAPGRVDIVLDWTAELPVLHVLDRGPGFRSRRKRERLPVDALSESGRGLFIVNACAPTFSVRNRNGRGTHASATLPLA
jgi:anti-sigma regulatory factor (Ser/Thr protein kinase)